MSKTNYKHYYLCENGAIIRVRAKRKPSLHTRPTGDTWVVQEYIQEQARWCVSWEITWGRLRELQYIGKLDD